MGSYEQENTRQWSKKIWIHQSQKCFSGESLIIHIKYVDFCCFWLGYWKDCGCLSFCLALYKLSIPFSIVFFVFLAQFSGPGEEKLKHAAATFCSNQPFALEMIKSRQKKDSRFQTFVQVSWVSHITKKKKKRAIFLGINYGMNQGDSKTKILHKGYIYVYIFKAIHNLLNYWRI